MGPITVTAGERPTRPGECVSECACCGTIVQGPDQFLVRSASGGVGFGTGTVAAIAAPLNPKAFMDAGKCSALVRLLPGSSDLMISQETWTASDRPCNVRREGGESLVIGGPSLVMLEGREGNPL